MKEVSKEQTNRMIANAVKKIGLRKYQEEVTGICPIDPKPVGKWEDMGLNGDMYRKMMAEYLKRTGYRGW